MILAIMAVFIVAMQERQQRKTEIERIHKMLVQRELELRVEDYSRYLRSVADLDGSL